MISLRKSKTTVHAFCVLYFLLHYGPVIFSFTALRPWYIVALHLRPLSYRGIGSYTCSLYQSMHCSEPLYQICLHIAIIFISLAARIFFEYQKQLIIPWHQLQSQPLYSLLLGNYGVDSACLTDKRRRDAPSALGCWQRVGRSNTGRWEVQWRQPIARGMKLSSFISDTENAALLMECTRLGKRLLLPAWKLVNLAIDVVSSFFSKLHYLCTLGTMTS